MAGAEILPGDCSGSAHQPDRRPRYQREQLRVRHGECSLRRGALRERPDERHHEEPTDVHRDSLDSCRKPEPEERADDVPVGTTEPAWETYDPGTAPQLHHG